VSSIVTVLVDSVSS